jgi:hypothetical protein
MAEAILCGGSLARQPMQRRDQRQKDELAGCKGESQVSLEVRVLGRWAWAAQLAVPRVNVARAGPSAPGSPLKCPDKFEFVRNGF